ncbi:MAG: hypothetical protein V7695_19175 [Sulfitobacter sp.]
MDQMSIVLTSGTVGQQNDGSVSIAAINTGTGRAKPARKRTMCFASMKRQ